MKAYLDNSATTKVCRKAREYMLDALDNNWGNPSSLHQRGIDAQQLLSDARACAAKALCCEKNELYFTSGGTQGNNIAVFGAANALRRRGNRVVTSSVEHPSVSKAFDRLESEGFEVIRLPVDRFGTVSTAELESALNEKTVLVSIMAVNNELGTIEPVEQIGKIIKASGAPAIFHVDAVQAFGKIPVNVRKIGAQLVTVSSHKIHGPKGVGALYVKKGTRLLSPAVGGGQEKDIRPGTEPMPAIAGFYGAVEELNIQESLKRVARLQNSLVSRLQNMDGVVINSPDDALPYIINFSLPSLPSEAVLNLLSDMGVCVSSGSACAKGHKSPVLTAAGLAPEIINSSIRVSLSRFTSSDELDLLLSGIETALRSLRRTGR